MRYIKLSALLLISAVLFTLLPSGDVHAADNVEITSPSAVLMDAATGTVLFEKAPHEKRACASITKVMTLTLVMEAIEGGKIKWDDTVTTSEHAASMGGSDIWLEPGETMSVRDMVKAAVIASANDAAVALAELVSGSEDNFVAAMNKKAASLGMKDTTFKNCNGLDEEGHLSSAYDVALMSRDLIKHKDILNFTTTRIDSLRNGKTQLVNTNRLLINYKGITGLKTGTTSKAGSCISATAEREGLSLISVILGASDTKTRFKEAAQLLDYGFAVYTMYTPGIPEKALSNISVKNGISEAVKPRVTNRMPILIKKGEEKNIKCELSLPQEVEAPVERGQKLGSIIYKNGSNSICEYAVTASETVRRITLPDILLLLIRALAGA